MMTSASLSLHSAPLPPPSSQPCRLTTPEASPPLKNLKPIVVSGRPPNFVSAPGRRIVAIGDLHGDLEQAKRAFELAGILSSDGQDSWIGGETVLVQVGDVLDRGEDEIAILSLLRSLDVQARDAGGAVFQINGNHETMNVEGDFRYVDPGAFEECNDFLEYLEDCGNNWGRAFLHWSSVSQKRRETRMVSHRLWDPWSIIKRQKGVIARSYLLNPGGPLARELAKHPVVLKVNNWVFCHGGLLPKHVDYGIERINREVSSWMQGVDEKGDEPQVSFVATRGYDSVVWNRLYSSDSVDRNYQRQVCATVEETLEALGAKAMIVGHTPQPVGVNCKCDQKVWRIDVGMSGGVLNSRPEVLEIMGDNTRILRSEKDVLDGQEPDYF